jgi:hypothetical protein
MSHATAVKPWTEQDGRIKARSCLAEACRHKPTVDDDRSARDVGTAEAPGPHSQVTLGPFDRRRDRERHRLLVPFEDYDRTREVAARGAGPNRWGNRRQGGRFQVIFREIT